MRSSCLLRRVVISTYVFYAYVFSLPSLLRVTHKQRVDSETLKDVAIPVADGLPSVFCLIRPSNPFDWPHVGHSINQVGDDLFYVSKLNATSIS
jgi:hypothetical protein